MYSSGPHLWCAFSAFAGTQRHLLHNPILESVAYSDVSEDGILLDTNHPVQPSSWLTDPHHRVLYEGRTFHTMGMIRWY